MNKPPSSHNIIIVPNEHPLGEGVHHQSFKPTAMSIQLCTKTTSGSPNFGPPRSALLDTGAGMSLIDYALVDPLQINHDHTVRIQGLGTTHTLGHITLQFLVASSSPQERKTLKFTHEFHVVDKLPPGIILGSDFIFPHQVHIDGIHKLAGLTLGKVTHVWKIWPLRRISTPTQQAWSLDPTPTEAILYATTDTDIPPFHHAWVPVRRSQPLSSEDFTVSPAVWKEETSDVIFSIPGALFSKSWPYVLVSNLGSDPGRVPSNLPLCTALAVTSDSSDYLNTGQQFTINSLSVTPASSVTLSEGARPFDHRDDVDDESGKQRLVADSTTLVDGVFNVGPASTPDIISTLRAFVDVFAIDGKPGHVKGFPLSIPLKPEAKLVAEPPRRTSPEKRDIIDATIQQLLENDVIEPSSSPTSYPVLLVRQGAKWRMCVDYRGLNLLTVDDKYPLPRMDDVFECLSNGKVFSSVDAISGYFQLDVAREDQYKTAFVCHKGLFHFKRVPFGLKNAPAHYQRFMDTLLGSMRWNNAMVYLDDAVIFSDSPSSHAGHLATFLSRCREHGLRLSPKKCFFAVTSLNLLGRLITPDGISIIPDRAEAIRNLPVPQSLHDVSHLLGLFNYYRPFIPRFAQLAAPLVAKQKGTRYHRVEGTDTQRLSYAGNNYRHAKEVKIDCDEPLIQCVEALKAALCTQVVLAFPDRHLPWFLYVDASRDGYAAALHQQFERPLHRQELTNDAAEVAASWVPLPTNFASIEEISAAQRDDNVWARIIASFSNSQPIRGYALSEDVLVRVDTDTVCLPTKLQDKALEIAHAGHPGYSRTYANIRAHFWHPTLAELTRAYVKHCPTCIRTKIRKRVGRLDVDDEFLGLPFHTISMDIIMGLPGPNDACLMVLDLFSKMVLFHPLTSSATSIQIAHALEHMVLRKGWQPRRIISDSDQRFLGEVAHSLADKIGAVITPSSPYHQAANPVERYVQTAVKSLKALMLDERPENWTDKLAALELSLNSTPSSVTGYCPFDLIYVHRPRLLGQLTEHSGVGTTEQRFQFSVDRLTQASESIKKAREEQRRRYDTRRQQIPTYSVGDLVMVRLTDRPMGSGRHRTKLDADLEGPYKIKTVLSDHRVELDLPPDLSIKQPFDVSQLQAVPHPNDDPFHRGNLTIDEPGGLYTPSRISGEDTCNGYRRYCVHWQGSSRPTWEFEDDLIDMGCEDLISEWLDRERLATPPLPEAYLAPSSEPPRPHLSSAHEANHPKPRPLKRPQIRDTDGHRSLVWEKPVAFASRETSPNEKRLAAIELEASALAWAYVKLLPLFEGCPIHVITDHSPLGSVMQGTSNRLLSPSLLKARQRLSPFIHLMTFHHRAGTTHNNVDALSRLPRTPLSTKAHLSP